MDSKEKVRIVKIATEEEFGEEIGWKCLCTIMNLRPLRLDGIFFALAIKNGTNTIESHPEWLLPTITKSKGWAMIMK